MYISTKQFDKLTPEYYLCVFVVAGIGTAAFYIMIGHRISTPFASLAISLICGLLLSPIVLLLAIAVLLIPTIGLLYAYYSSASSSKEGSKNSDSGTFEIKDALFKMGGTESTEQNHEFARSILGLKDKDFTLYVDYPRLAKSFIWTNYGNTSMVQLGSTTLYPKMILDTRLNESYDRALETGKYGFGKLNLGSDFGKIFTIYASKESSIDVYRVFSPTLMIDTLNLLPKIDAIFDENCINYIFETPTSTEELIVTIEKILTFNEQVEKSVGNHSGGFVDAAVHIKRSATSLSKIADKYFMRAFKAFVVFIFIGAIYASSSAIFNSGQSTNAGTLIISVVLTIIIINLLYIAYNLAVIGYAVSIEFIARIVLNAIMNFRRSKKEKQFMAIASKYAY